MPKEPEGQASPIGRSDVKYDMYLASPEWKAKCEVVLQRDGHSCRTCGLRTDLEVHHVTYERFTHEDLEDLITLCRECHEAITCVFRARRYENRPHEPEEVSRVTPTVGKEEDDDGGSKIEVQTHVRITPTYAQRTTGRPPE